MKRARSGKTTPKRVKNSPRRTGHPAQQHGNLATGRVGPTLAPAKAPPNQEAKRDKVLAMLRSKQGATIAAMMKATGWQQHSVRGFLTGVVRKRLKLDLMSDKTGKDRIYRIRPARPPEVKRTVASATT